MPRKSDTNYGKYRNITVDADIIEILRARSEELSQTLGFRPTVSQTLRHLLKKGE